MKKIFKIITLTIMLSYAAYAETKNEFIFEKTVEEKRAKYVLLNMQQDYITCYSFYKIGAEYVRKSDGDNNIINGIEKSADTSLRLAHETGEIMSMSVDKMSLKVKYEMKKQLSLIDNNFSNASILLEKYAKTCQNLIKNKKQRISYWEELAKKKINE